MQQALDLDGQCCGPLFGPLPIRRAPKNHGTRLPGINRRRAERRATPKWLTNSDINRYYQLMREAAAMTRRTGVTYSIDHIVPLQHPLVCGLHWHRNMRVVPLEDNVRKGTRWWPDMPEEQGELF